MIDLSIQFLRNFPFFEHLDHEELDYISSLFTERCYDKGVNIFFEGDEGNELFIIKSGVVKIYRQEYTREVILSIFRDGDFFGEMALLQNERVRSASAKTLDKSTVYALKKEDFSTLLKSNPETSQKILEAVLNRLRSANELITDLTILDARVRIARMLLRLVEQYGIQTKEGMLIDLKLTHQQMADMTGTVRETVTKSLLDLQHQGLIRIDQRKIMVCKLEDLKKVVSYA